MAAPLSTSGSALRRGSLARVLVLSALFVTLSGVALRPLSGAFLPVIAREIAVVDRNVRVERLELADEDTGAVLRMRANLREPLYLAEGTVYPRGWMPGTNGLYQVRLSGFGVLQAPTIFLIVLLAWRARSASEATARVLIALPLFAALLALDAPLDLLGNLQERMLVDAHVHRIAPLFVWDRFLEGGGGVVLALALALTAIVAGRRTCRGRAARASTAKAGLS
jgi:hypothetical protein